ncbi:MAG: SDR family oxidoreductase [Proteobacteria bacterium]|nr:SDR family oxidoreductase [Pseudomonadota bacterium]
MTHPVTPAKEDMFFDQTVIVTGAGGQIGSVIAQDFARAGAKVILIGRSFDKLARVRDQVLRTNGKASVQVGDIRSEEWVSETLGTIARDDAPVVSLVNCAGGQFVAPGLDITPQGWRAVVETNLTGTWLMTQAMARLWRDSGMPGSITQVTLSHSRGMPGMAHSCAARAGIEAFSRTMAIELGRHGIRINCVSPGLIETQTLYEYGADLIERLTLSGNPMGRLGRPADIAAACIYLASPGAAFVTGATLPVDGGQALWGDNWTIEKPYE